MTNWSPEIPPRHSPEKPPQPRTPSTGSIILGALREAPETPGFRFLEFLGDTINRLGGPDALLGQASPAGLLKAGAILPFVRRAVEASVSPLKAGRVVPYLARETESYAGGLANQMARWIGYGDSPTMAITELRRRFLADAAEAVGPEAAEAAVDAAIRKLVTSRRLIQTGDDMVKLVR